MIRARSAGDARPAFSIIGNIRRIAAGRFRDWNTINIKALEQIVIEVKDINTNVAAIVEASREQSTGLQEINTAVNTMDQGTQQNAALVEQSAAAADSLKQQAEQLVAAVAVFKIGH